MNFGVTDQGFVLKDYESILADLQTRARQYLGPDIDLDDYSPLGQMFAAIAYEFARHWQLLEATYYTAYIDTAQAASLDRVVAGLNIERNPATRARGDVTFSRSTTGSTLVIPAGTRVSTPDGIIFSTLEQTLMPADALSLTIEVLADLPGAAGNVAASRIRNIISPVAGIETVINPAAMTGGADTETDAALRARAKLYAPDARATAAAIRSALLDVDGVTGATIAEDLNGNTVIAVVTGGEDADLLEAIEASRPAGIPVLLQRPQTTPVDVVATVTAAPGYLSPAVEQSVVQTLNQYLAALPLGATIDYSDILGTIVHADGVDSLLSCSATIDGQPVSALGDTVTVDVDEQPAGGTHSITVQ